MKKITLIVSALLFGAVMAFAQKDIRNGTGLYEFADEANLWVNTADGTGGAGTMQCDGVFKYAEVEEGHNNVQSEELTDYSVIDGINDKAISLTAFNWIKIWHGIPVNGGGDWVNDFTVTIDVRVPYADSIYALLEVNPASSENGYAAEMEIANLKVGSNDKPWIDDMVPHSTKTLEVNKWYRITYVAKLGEFIKIYVDGEVWNSIEGDFTDSRPAPYSADNHADNAALRVGGNNEQAPANNPQRDADKDIDMVAIFAEALSAQDVADLGQAGNITSIKNTMNSQKILKAYPNPASDVLNIEGSGTYQVYNSIGQVVNQGVVKESTELKVNHLDHGVYFVKLTDINGKTATSKVLVK